MFALTAASRMAINSSRDWHPTTIFVEPALSQSTSNLDSVMDCDSLLVGESINEFKTACPTWAASFPFLILRSFLTTITCLYECFIIIFVFRRKSSLLSQTTLRRQISSWPATAHHGTHLPTFPESLL